MDNCLVRVMREDDLPAVTALYTEMYKEQKDFGMVMSLRDEEMGTLLSAQLKSKLHYLLVLQVEGAIKGFASAGIVKLQRKYALEDQDFIGYIHDLYVRPECRSKGMAKQLLLKMEECLKEAGVSYMELQVLSGNELGQLFWEKMGYQDVIHVMYKRI